MCELHRKLVRHFDQPGHFHHLTFSCYQRLPLLTAERRCHLLAQSIHRATQAQQFSLIAFVFMPEHVHLIVFPLAVDSRIQNLLYAIKRPFSFRVKQELIDHQDPLLTRLTVRERPGKTAFRFWQEGPGYDSNLTEMDTVRVAIDYIHANPIRRGLCERQEDWKWSSYRPLNDPDWNDPDLPILGPFPDIY